LKAQRKSATKTFRGRNRKVVAALQACVLGMGVCCVTSVWAQEPAPKISRIEIEFAGPKSVSADLIRGNIRSRVGEPYRAITVDDDIRSLYSTDLFYNIRVRRDAAEDGGVVITYVLQANPRLTEVLVQGNAKIKEREIRKKITSKIGQALDERKLFTDARAIEELYQKKGYPRTTVKYALSIDEGAGQGTATFEIQESPKVKITNVEFAGAEAFSQKQLRKVLKGTRRHWMFSWLTRGGYFRDEKFEEDQELLKTFYREKGYIDFDLQKVEFDNETPTRMVVRLHVTEGQQYKVGQIKFQGTTMLPTEAIKPDFDPAGAPATPEERRTWSEALLLNRDFTMKEGETFTMKGMRANATAIENFYDARGHIDVSQEGKLRTRRIPNPETGTMDLEYTVEEGQKSFVEKIEIRGNTKTKDKVVRRELAISPGETFDMTRVKLSQRRLQGLGYFSKVDARPENTDLPNRKDLVISVEEQRTGRMSFGAGFSSIDSLVAYTEITQGNFDLFHPPYFTGGGQKFRLQLQVGTERQDYVLSLTEPWFLDQRLSLTTELYHQRKNYQSLGNLYDEVRTGARVGLSKALPRPLILDELLGKGDFIGSVYYNIENVGILLDDDLHGFRTVTVPPLNLPQLEPNNAPLAILNEDGYALLTRVGMAFAYDTRNDVRLPNGGQRTELSAELTSSYLGGERDYYKLQLETAWYFTGLLKGHVLEFGGRSGVVEGLDGDTVPFYDRFYLGGLYSLRGFRYRAISPREADPQGGYFREPVGGHTFWFGSVEYSIPIVESEAGAGLRLAAFYDIGSVGESSYSFNADNFSDNWGLGVRINIPQLGPLRIDYGIPLHYDEFSNGKARIQFGVGWQRPF
jgi:outer membrane protein insertion porin family